LIYLKKPLSWRGNQKVDGWAKSPPFLLSIGLSRNYVQTMQMKPIESKVASLITDALAAMGYELVRVALMSGGRYTTLQVMAERNDNKPMTVDDCAKISHAASEILDEDDTMANHYTLEISSPGIDRPLVRLKDFERFTGHVARIELETPKDGQRRFMGSIVRIKGNEPDAEIELQTEDGAVHLLVSAIAKAKLVLTDALIAAHTDNAEQQS
jgi:ribosome maturation factor RimP